jgi:hypothetical protein
MLLPHFLAFVANKKPEIVSQGDCRERFGNQTFLVNGTDSSQQEWKI